MNGRAAKKLRREAVSTARSYVRKNARIRERWWFRPLLAVARLLRATPLALSDETVRRLARRGVVAEF